MRSEKACVGRARLSVASQVSPTTRPELGVTFGATLQTFGAPIDFEMGSSLNLRQALQLARLLTIWQVRPA